MSFGCRAFLDFTDNGEIADAGDDGATPDGDTQLDSAADEGASDGEIACPYYDPPEGAYTYAVVDFSELGDEQLFILTGGGKEPDAAAVNTPIGPTFPGTVIHEDGGMWSFKVQVTPQHFEQYTFIAGEAGLRVPHVVESLFSIPISANCSPAVDAIQCPMVPDASWSGAASGTFGPVDGSPVNASLVFKYVGIDSWPIEGALVPTYHVVEERTLFNAVSGHQTNEYWYAVKDGLLVHGKVTVGVLGSHMVDGVQFNFFGADEFKEFVEYQITSLKPGPLPDAGADAD